MQPANVSSLPHVLSLSEIGASAKEALSLLAAYPFRWLVLTVLFLIVVEGLMFIPYVGFIVKLSMAALLGTQIIVMFAAAANRRVPRFKILLGAFAILFKREPPSEFILFAHPRAMSFGSIA